MSSEPRFSDDGAHWWDGYSWFTVSSDGSRLWDGSDWVPFPSAEGRATGPAIAPAGAGLEQPA